MESCWQNPPRRLHLLDFIDAQKGAKSQLLTEQALEKKEILFALKSKGRLSIDMKETITYEAVSDLSQMGLVQEGQSGMLYPTDALLVRWAIDDVLEEVTASNANRRMDELAESIGQKRAMMQLREA